MANDRSRNPSRACSRAGSVKDFSLDSSRFSDSPSSETKQGLILDVRKNLDNLLCSHFKHKFEGNVMIVYSDSFMHQLDEQRDVLRGNRVANIRAKSKESLKNLASFVEAILATDELHKVLRVDLVLQRQQNKGLLKGLLVNLQFRNTQDLLHVRDAVWLGRGFKQFLPKFMPAVFAQDCSWKGLPKNFHYVETPEGDLRVRQPFPKKLQELQLEENCRIKSMSVSWRAGASRKVRTFEVPPDQFLQVLSQGRYTDKKGDNRQINNNKTLTISFDEPWKTKFWREPADSATPVSNPVHG